MPGVCGEAGMKYTPSVSDVRALRGLTQRNGGALTPARARRLLIAGWVVVRDDVAECYPARAVAYSLTAEGRRWVERAATKGKTKP